jgi:tRNA A58 N-methylase Trm61
MRTADGLELSAEYALAIASVWAPRVYGRVLEIGLGLGYLADAVQGNRKVSSHTIVERNAEILERVTAPARATLVRGSFPAVELGGRYDCILLDVPDAIALVRPAAELLAPSGILFVRRE